MGAQQRSGRRRAEKVAKRKQRRLRETRSSVDDARARFAELAAAMEPESPMRPLMLAAAELGYLVTGESEHEFTEDEVEAFVEVAERHGAVFDDDDGTDELLDLISEQVLDVVAHTVDTADPEHGRSFAARVLDADEYVSDEDDRYPGATMATLVLVDWLRAANERGVLDASELGGWLADRLHLDDAELARAGAFADAVTSRDPGRLDVLLVEEIVVILPALGWLVAALVAVRGEGAVAWLSTLDEEHSGDS